MSFKDPESDYKEILYYVYVLQVSTGTSSDKDNSLSRTLKAGLVHSVFKSRLPKPTNIQIFVYSIVWCYVIFSLTIILRIVWLYIPCGYIKLCFSVIFHVCVCVCVC